MHGVVMINDDSLGVFILPAYLIIQDFENRNQLGYSLLQVGDRPLFQCFRQDGMIGVCTGFGYCGNGIIQRHAPCCHQPDQFRNNHSRMGVIDLDSRIICQICQLTALCSAFIQNQLRAGRNHQIFLIYPEQTTVFIAVIRIEEEGKVFLHGSFIKVNAVLHQCFVYCFNIEQMEGVGGVIFIARHQNVIHSCLHRTGSEGNCINRIRLFQPALVCNPGIRLGSLDILLKHLMEQAEVIVQSDAISVQSQRCNGVQKAGCQSSKTAVAQ